MFDWKQRAAMGGCLALTIYSPVGLYMKSDPIWWHWPLFMLSVLAVAFVGGMAGLMRGWRKGWEDRSEIAGKAEKMQKEFHDESINRLQTYMKQTEERLYDARRQVDRLEQANAALHQRLTKQREEENADDFRLI